MSKSGGFGSVQYKSYGGVFNGTGGAGSQVLKAPCVPAGYKMRPAGYESDDEDDDFYENEYSYVPVNTSSIDPSTAAADPVSNSADPDTNAGENSLQVALTVTKPG